VVAQEPASCRDSRLPGVSRWKRRLAAAIELAAGLAFPPFLFLCGYLRGEAAVPSRRDRRLIAGELAAMARFWGRRG
jgi:hypothetical protein